MEPAAEFITKMIIKHDPTFIAMDLKYEDYLPISLKFGELNVR